MDEEERKAFFINMFNFLMIHAKVSALLGNCVTQFLPRNGSPFFLFVEPTIQRSEYEYVYMIGKHKFCLADIYHGILRCNRKPAGLTWKRFGAGDARAEFMLSTFDHRIHFALVCQKNQIKSHIYSADRIQ